MTAAHHLRGPFLGALLAFFITMPILGVSIRQSAQGLSLTPQFMNCVYAALAVFVGQLLLNLYSAAREG